MTARKDSAALPEALSVPDVGSGSTAPCEWTAMREELHRLRARVAEHLIMFKSNDDTIAKLREIIVANTELTDRLRARERQLVEELTGQLRMVRRRRNASDEQWEYAEKSLRAALEKP